MKTETTYYDATGNQVKNPREAVRAEVTTYDDMGQRVRVEYYTADNYPSYESKIYNQSDAF